MLLVYGATGFTGRIVARAVARVGLDAVLAGRREDAVRAVAQPLGLAARAGGLDDIDLDGVSVVLNCAGPFARTQPPLVQRCLRAGAHYLDLAGEVDEHVALQRRDAEARAAGVLLLPGAGYGIVASDCLAALVAGRVGGAPQRVEVSLKTQGGVSRGTAEAVLGNLRTPGVQRRSGRLVAARAGAERARVDFGDGDGPTTVVTNPWRADLAASVPAAEEYVTRMAFPAPVRALMRVPHGGLLRAVARRLPEGPSDAALAEGACAVHAAAVGAGGARATASLRGPDAYLLSGLTAAACARRALAPGAPTGFHTPASAFGPELLDDIPELERSEP